MNNLQWKRRLAKIYPTPSNQKIRKVVLLYHAVGKGPQALSPTLFQKQIQWLQQQASIFSLTDLLTSNHRDPLQVAITFDDGYACLYDVVLPILSSSHFPATVYINTGWIAEDQVLRKASRADLGHTVGEQFLIWDEVSLLQKQSWEIASHGVNHFDLTQQMPDVIEYELNASKKMIETRLNKNCVHFAYTWGKHTPALQRAISKAGYQYAAAAHHAPLNNSDNPLAFPRVNIEAHYDMTDFANIVKGKWDYLKIIQQVKQWI